MLESLERFNVTLNLEEQFWPHVSVEAFPTDQFSRLYQQFPYWSQGRLKEVFGIFTLDIYVLH